MKSKWSRKVQYYKSPIIAAWALYSHMCLMTNQLKLTSSLDTIILKGIHQMKSCFC